MAEKHVIESQTEKLLRSEQRHTSLFGRSITFSLVALHTRRDKVSRRAFTALRTRQDVIERQVFRMLVIAAVLAAIAIANVDACTLHGRLAAIAADVDVVPKPDHRRDREGRRRRMKNIVAVLLFDENSTAKPKADGTSDADGAQRLVRKIQ